LTLGKARQRIVIH